MVAGLISQALQNIQPNLRSNGFGIANSHRRLTLTFIPPSTKSPLFQYNSSPNQRSFLSLGTEDGLNRISEEDEDRNEASEEEGEPLSRTVSLPSQMSEEPELDWLLQEHQRRYSSMEGDDSGTEGDNVETEVERAPSTQDYHGYQDDSEDFNYFMSRVRKNHSGRRPSLRSIGSIAIRQSSTEDFDYEKVTLKSEIVKLTQYSIPLIVTFLLEQLFAVVSVLVVGRIGKNELAAVSLATMTSNIVLAVFEGIATALDTLCPQAYGSGNFVAVGVHFQRCAALSLTLFIPFGILLWYSAFFLRFLVPEEELVVLAAQFLRVLLFGAPAYILFENLKRYLQAQGVFEAGTYVLLICAPLNIIVSYVLVWNQSIGVGYIGGAIANLLNFWLMFILLVAYVIFIDGSKCWGGFSRKSLNHWKDLLHLAIPGVVMLEAESLSYEVMTLFASYFGTTYLATQSALSVLGSLTYMVPFSIGIASSTRIANFIGAKRIDCAKLASKIGVYASLLSGFVNCIVLLIFRIPLSYLFSKDPAVVKMTADIMPLVALVQIFDAMSAVAGSCLRGQGMQRLGSYINLFVYYVIGVPLAWIFGYYLDYKLVGLWLSIGFGLLLIGFSESWYVLNADWDGILNEANDRESDIESLESASVA